MEKYEPLKLYQATQATIVQNVYTIAAPKQPLIFNSQRKTALKPTYDQLIEKQERKKLSHPLDLSQACVPLIHKREAQMG